MKVGGDDRWSRLNQVSLHILYVYIVYTYVILYVYIDVYT